MLLRQMQRARFRGIEFFWVSSSLAGGRKTVTHEYVNNDRRFVEDLGKNQKTFTVQGVIAGPRYLRNRNALIEALEKPGVGILVHPIDGSQNVVLKTFAIDEDETKLGEARISMTFEKADLNIFPTQTSNNTSLISKLTTALITLTSTDFLAKYNLTSGIIANYNSAVGKVNDVLDAVESATDGITSTVDSINELSSGILDIRQRINSIVTLPDELAAALTGLFNSLDGFASIPEITDGDETPLNSATSAANAQLELLTKFYTFGDEDAPVDETTPQRIERKNNEDAFNDFVLTDSLTLTFEAILNVTFANTDEIDNVREIINNQTNIVIERESISPEIRDSILEQKLEIDQFLDQQETVTPKVSEVQTAIQPLMALGYRYNGNTDDFETLVTLNNNPDINFIEGTVKVLTQ